MSVVVPFSSFKIQLDTKSINSVLAKIKVPVTSSAGQNVEFEKFISGFSEKRKVVTNRRLAIDYIYYHILLFHEKKLLRPKQKMPL